jgi:predicted MFS family arabinose efflux permease
MRRLAASLIYLAIFAGEMLWNGFVPLVPELSQRFDLSKLQAGVLLGTTSAFILLVSLPAATVCERFGPRRLTVLSTFVIAASALVQGFASSYGELIAGRALFGIGFGVLWITGLRWLAEIAGTRESQALSLTVTTAGLAAVVGPALAGVTVTQFGMGPPFVVIAVVNALLALAMWWEPTGSGMATTHEQPLTEMLRVAASDRLVVVSLVVTMTAALMGAAISLLVPLQLHANGVSTTEIGAAFGLSAAVFIVCSATVARAAERAVRIRVAVWALAGSVVVIVIPVVGESTPALVGFLLARAPMTALLFTIAFPLGALGARRAGITVGAVAALINIAWSVVMLVGPVVFAVIAQTMGDRAAYVVLMAVFVCSIAWIVRPWRHSSPVAALSAPSDTRPR